jgi:ATP-binding cassette subfamily B protein
VPVCTANLIDIVQTTLSQNLSFADQWQPLLINSLFIVISLLQNILTHTLYARLTDNMLRNASASLRESVVRKLQHLSITFSHEIASGDLQAKFLRDVTGTEDYLTTLFKTFIPLIITSLITYGIVIYKSWLVALFFLCAVPLDIILIRLFSNRIKKESHEYRLANESLSRGFTTMIEMTPVVKAHGLEDIEIESMTKKVEVVRSKGLNLDSSIAVFGSSIFVISGLLNFACLFFCIYLAINKQIGIGEIVLFEGLFQGMNGRIQSLLNLFPSLATGKEAIASLSELMSKEEIQTIPIKSISPIWKETSPLRTFFRLSFERQGSDQSPFFLGQKGRMRGFRRTFGKRQDHNRQSLVGTPQATKRRDHDR